MGRRERRRRSRRRKEKKKRQTFVLSRMHMCCGARSGKNKAGCLLFAGCGNRFASMPSLSHEGRERGIRKKRDGGSEGVRSRTVRREDLLSAEKWQRERISSIHMQM